MSKLEKWFNGLLKQQKAIREGKGKQTTWPAITAPTAVKPSPKTKMPEKAECVVVPSSCENQKRPVQKRIAPALSREEHASSKQRRITPPPQHMPPVRSADLPPPMERPTQVKPICSSIQMPRVGVCDRRIIGNALGVSTKDESGKLRPIANVGIEIAEKMQGGQHASIALYLKFAIERVTAMKVEVRQTFYSVVYKMPDCPGETWLTAKDILLYDGEKELDDFLCARDMLPLFSGGPHRKSGASLLAGMTATVNNTTSVLQEIAEEEGVDTALAELARAREKLAAIPTASAAQCDVKRVKKGAGRAASKRAWKAARDAAYADLNEKQLEMLAALDSAWSRIRIAIASVESFADIHKKLLYVAQKIGDETSGETQHN